MTAPRTVAIENVTAIPLDGDARLASHTVLVRDDRISWVGPASAAKVPDDAMRIDGRGRFVIPGLADMHAHPRTEDDLLLFLANGVTTVRNMWGTPRHVGWRDRIAQGEMLGPALHTAGPLTDGDPTMRVGAESVGTLAEAVEAVGRAARAGYEAIKVYDHHSPESYDALVRAAADRGLPVVGHVPFRVGLARALAASQRSIEHLYGYIEAMQPVGSPLRECLIEPAAARRALAEGATERADRGRIPELVSATKAAGIWNCPTLMIRRRHLQTLDELLARRENAYFDPPRVESWRQFKLTYPFDTSHKGLELSLLHQITKALHDAGAGLLAGTDSGVHFIFNGASLHEELEELVTAGLTPHEALVVGSRNAAEFLGEADDWGTVAAGRRADLVVLTADPTSDIRNTRRIDGVMVRGRWLSRSELDAMLERVARAANAVPDWAPGDMPPAPAPPDFAARYELEWAGIPVGAEEVRVERAAGGGRRIRSRAHLETFTGQGIDAWDAGRHSAEIELGPDGRPTAARYASETPDGGERGELRRAGAAVLVDREEPILGRTAERHDAAPDALLGPALTACYLQLSERVRALGMGESAEVQLIGPGMPPDHQTRSTAYRIERIADEGGLRRYRFAA
ncbi:MAG TPA: amidohydrolase family protein, partial [Candidatus Limnocylindria bacterium]